MLGPVELAAGSGLLDLGPPQRRAVLAALAVDAGQAVAVDTLVARVWDEPPDGARRVLYAHITRIRRVLDQLSPDAGPVRLVHRSGGYVLEVDRDLVDLHRFRRLVRQAGEEERPDPERAALLRDALSRWRGVPLSGLAGAWVARTRHGWQQQHIEAVLDWAQVQLRLGHAGEVIGDLPTVIADYPLVEPLAAALMRALHAAGRGTEALRHFALARERLVEELGAEPGAELRELHQAILTGGPDPLPPARTGSPAASAPAAPPVLPAQLPPDVAGFTGRGAELARLDGVLSGHADQPTAVVISALSGTAGVGKTALAVHWAHLVADRFPDGQLYVDLRGYDPEQPVPPADALATFLRDLGLSGGEVPPDLAGRTARYRSLLAGRRMLVLLDNASSVEQVRPLLPGGPSCTAIVTSRDRLPGLVARDGAHRIDLDLLPAADAVALLRHLIGARVDAEPDAAALLVRRCVGLPLALRVAAELVVSRGEQTIGGLADELGEEHRRLDLLDAAGDARTAVRAVFSWSYRSLPPDAALLFRLLGNHPGDQVDVGAAAALADLSEPETRRLLGILAQGHLVEPVGADRYRMHDLLRAYAAELAAAAADAERRPALTRLLDHCVAAAQAATDALGQADRTGRHRVDPAGTAVSTVDDAGTAAEWLAAERSNLVAAAALASTRGWPRHAVLLAAAVARHLETIGRYDDAIAIHTHALRAAEATGDHGGAATALRYLGRTYGHLGRYHDAVAHQERALVAERKVGDREGEARANNNIGQMYCSMGYPDRAIDQHQCALVIQREIGDQAGIARSLACLALAYYNSARYDDALDHFHRALEMFRGLSDREGEERTLTNIGTIYRRRGDCDRAERHIRAGLAIATEIGDRVIGAAAFRGELAMVRTVQGRHAEAIEILQQVLPVLEQTGHRPGLGETHHNVGVTYQAMGRYAEALDHHTQSLAFSHAAGQRCVEARALNGLGAALRAGGSAGDALGRYQTALALAVEIGERFEQGRAQAGIAASYADLGQPDRAVGYWRQAVALFTEIGVPDADEARARLAAVESAGAGAPR